MTTQERILVYFKDSDQELKKANFTECIVNHFSCKVGALTTNICLKLHDRKLVISKPSRQHEALSLIKLKLAQAGLRELEEETGLHLITDMCENGRVTPLAVWESVYPPKLTLGQPKRHHAVIYLHAKLHKDITAEKLTSKVKVDPGEVGACAWFDLEKIKAIVSVVEGEAQKTQGNLEKYSKEKISALVLTEDKKQVRRDIPFSDLLKASGDSKDQKGRVSTGTKFALKEWLSLQS